MSLVITLKGAASLEYKLGVSCHPVAMTSHRRQAHWSKGWISHITEKCYDHFVEYDYIHPGLSTIAEVWKSFVVHQSRTS